MKTVKLEHVYECYPIYSLLYGRDIDAKAFEAVNACIAAEHFWMDRLNQKSKLSILEMFAGISEHKNFFLQSCKAPISRYACLDNQPGVANDDVVIGDAITDEYPGSFNFLIAYYYSLATCIYDANYIHSRESMVKFLRNVQHNLTLTKGTTKRSGKPKGGFYFNLSSNGYFNALANIGTPIKKFEYHVPICHPIRKMFGIDAYAKSVMLTADTKRTYDRMLSTNYDYLENVQLWVGNKVVAKFKIARPFSHRFWSETEIVDIAKEVGFTDIVFYNNMVASGEDLISSHSTLKPLIKYPDIPYLDGEIDDGNAMENYMTSDMLLIA